MGGIVTTTLPEDYTNLPESSQKELTSKFQALLSEGKSECEAIECLRLQNSTTEDGTVEVGGGGGGSVDEYIPLTDLVTCIEKAVANGKTPLIIDRSAESLVETFFSYQSATIINAKKMGLDKSLRKIPVAEIMEGVRVQLVGALGYGYPVIVTMGNGVCDFNTTFTDEVYTENNSILDLKEGSLAYFPRSVFQNAGRGLLEESVMDKLFRPEDTKESAGIAHCRNPDTFYVALTTRFSLEDFEEYLWGNEWGLPKPKEMYHCIAIQYGEETELLT